MALNETALLQKKQYPHGFSTSVAVNRFDKGLNEETIRRIAQERKEPDFLLNFRLQAYAQWKTMHEPRWAHFIYPSSPIDYQNLSYYSRPPAKKQLESLDEVDPEILDTFNKLGIPLEEQKRLSNVAIDAVFDSVSIVTTCQEELKKVGVLFCSFAQAVHDYPELVERYLGTVVPPSDNFFATLNSAVFSDGSFVYVPRGVHCPIELSSYFRINDRETGQFERTLIIVEEGASVSYLEGCTAPAFSTNQLHAAVVELVAKKEAHIRYSTVQNWYPGDLETGEGGVFNYVTKRGKCVGEQSKITWIQVEVGSAMTWKYPSCILSGRESIGEFYSIALTNGHMQADTGTKMVHIGEGTRSKIISKGIATDCSRNIYRGLVHIAPSAKGARNYTCCDSMLMGNRCKVATIPVLEIAEKTAKLEHEASTSKIDEEQLHYLSSRGLTLEESVSLIVTGFCKEILHRLPLEFAAEADQLLSLKLSQSVG